MTHKEFMGYAAELHDNELPPLDWREYIPISIAEERDPALISPLLPRCEFCGRTESLGGYILSDPVVTNPKGYNIWFVICLDREACRVIRTFTSS
jgi:hypothetical protein